MYGNRTNTSKSKERKMVSIRFDLKAPIVKKAAQKDNHAPRDFVRKRLKMVMLKKPTKTNLSFNLLSSDNIIDMNIDVTIRR